ncbi:MAG TPA: hypothetical protein VFA28_21335 [Bryobacteraceae bacterium]|jgi:hypothetical protein|nr:hypothetical protein [Bryobacteraceae bacterium]
MTLGEMLTSGLFLQSIGIVGLIFSKKAAPAEPALSSPAEQKSPEDLRREELRNRHGVRLIGHEDEGLGIHHAPAGSYGWTCAPLTESPLFAKRIFQSFEVHKTVDGAEYVLGFVTRAEAAAIESGAVGLEIKLYPESNGDATELISLPFDRVHAKTRQPSRSGGNWIGVIIEAA